MITLEKKFDKAMESAPVTKIIREKVDYSQIKKMIDSQLAMMEQEIKYNREHTEAMKKK